MKKSIAVFYFVILFIGFSSCRSSKNSLLRNSNRQLFHYEHSVIINKPLQTVWEYMDDLDNNKQYQSFLKSVSKNTEGPITVGTELTYNFGFLFKNFTNYYRVTNYEPPYKMSFESMVGSAVEATGTNKFEIIDSLSTKLTIIFDPKVSGFFKNKSDEEIDKIYNKTLINVLKKIKKNLERNKR